ncbi:Nn.00g044300.m01.CDS01 [Neocucurbitaria sp. VM-36]
MSTTAGGVLLSHAALCPPPLFIRKKTRRATFRRSIFRKSTHSQNSYQYAFGPLDDIIDEIKSDIWESPPDYNSDPSINDWASVLNAPSTWIVTPLPVSRIPSDRPLTIRKNRTSRSSTSGSSMGDLMAYSRKNSHDERTNNTVGSPYSTDTIPWPLLDTTKSHEFTHPPNLPNSTVGTEYLTAQQALENVMHDAEARAEATNRRPSRLRLFTNGFPRLRRTGTGETSNSTEAAPNNLSPVATLSPTAYVETEINMVVKDPSEEAVEAYMRKHARNGTKFGSVMKLITRQLPSPIEDHLDTSDDHSSPRTSIIPTTLRAAVRIFPETKLLADEYQEFSVAVDVEGVLHNRKSLPDTTLDVIFVVDNGYYVTKECLDRALDAVNGALYYLGRGDRTALYTTHCTHHAVTGNRPDLHYPLRPFSADSEEIFRNLTSGIAVCGTQVWKPPRPNPSMAEVILGIARSLENQNLKPGRTHVILLSSGAHILHGISRYFPDLCIHHINPATLPCHRDMTLQDNICTYPCCRNVFISNWTSYQSVTGCMKRIIKNARAEKPVGELTNVSIDVRTRHGCELIESCGSKDIPNLRLGQVHTLLVRIRITRAETQGVDLDTDNPVLSSSLDIKGLRQDLKNSIATGAIKVHLFDVQTLHRNSLHAVDCWNYTETPLVVIREMGGLAPPLDTSMEVYKRQYFQKLVQLKTKEAKAEAQNLLSQLDGANGQAKKYIQHITKEIDCHQAIQDYEQSYRQKLPLCPGPITVESAPHDWLMDESNRKKSKRKGVAVVKKGEEMQGLIDGINGLERLG